MKEQIISSYNSYILNIINNNIFDPAPQSYFLTKFIYESEELFLELKTHNLNIHYCDVEDNNITLEKNKYKIFVVNNKICIGFNYVNDVQKYSFVVEYENQSENIQLKDFESIDRYIKMGRDHQWGGFVFLDSCPAVDAAPSFEGGRSRCDMFNYGPHGWGAFGSSVGSNSVDVGGKTMSAMGLNLVEFDPIINVPKCGHICYVRMGDMTWGSNNLYGMEMPFVARTLPEMFKIIIEWAEVTESPWNNAQDIAIKAKKFIEALDIPEDVYNSMSQNQASMHTFMYLNGNENARMRPELDDVKNFEKIVVDWLKTKFTYLQFSNMVNAN